MNLVLNIILLVGPWLLGTYLAIVNMPIRQKIIAWVICLFICICGVYRVFIKKKGKEKEGREEDYYRHLLERQELYAKGRLITYVNGLGETPLLKDFFNTGQTYQKESKFKEAIEEFKKCLSHPKATEENKVAANNLIGNCYHSLSKPKKAEKHLKQALSISKKVKNRDERLRGRSAALGNMGIIYRGLGKPDDALKYYKEALEIDRRIGYKRGMADSLGNIGIIYSDQGKPDEALKYLKESLEIFRRIGAQRQINITLKNIGIVEEEKKKRKQ